MAGSRWNPQRKMWRDQPDALIGGYFHVAGDGVDQLIRPVRVFRHLEPRGVFIGERGYRDTALWIVFGQNAVLSQ